MKLNTYIFAVDPFDKEIVVKATCEQDARREAWASMSDAGRDSVASLELVEIIDA